MTTDVPRHKFISVTQVTHPPQTPVRAHARARVTPVTGGCVTCVTETSFPSSSLLALDLGSTLGWPIGLPPRMNANGFTETLPDLALRTEMDAGPRKMRRRFTTGPTAIEGTVTLRGSQPALLETFYRDTTAGGTLPFDWTHPRTGALRTCRFTGPPAFVPVAGDVWRASLKLEVLP